VGNDPASHLVPDNGASRVPYELEEFEDAWAPHSGGTVDVIHLESGAVGKPLPTSRTDEFPRSPDPKRTTARCAPTGRQSGRGQVTLVGPAE
jgi:hypothetical protein